MGLLFYYVNQSEINHRYIFYDDCRLLGVTININTCSCYFLNVYLPYQCDDNYDVFVEYIGKLSALIDEVSTSNLILLGDFNAAVNTTFESELVALCTSYKLYELELTLQNQHSYQ